MRKLNINEHMVLDLYEEHKSGQAVADRMGCSDETIYRILRRHGVSRAHRHPKKMQKHYESGCHTKYCNTLIVMLRRHTSMTHGEIVELTGYPSSVVGNITRRRCPDAKAIRKHKSEYDIDAMVHEYRDLGMTSYELGEKYGVNPSTIRKWMRKEGVCIGKENANDRVKSKNSGQGALVLQERMRDRVVQKLIDDGDTLELLDHDFDGKFLLRCKVCGHEFKRVKGSYGHTFTCPQCHECSQYEKTRKRDERRQQVRAAREWRKSVPRICKECGDPFWSEYDNAAYCSPKCRKRVANRRIDIRKKRNGKRVGANPYKRRMRIEVNSHTYDRTVTLDAVFARHHGICCECGRKTVRSKSYTPLQATLDHVIALNNGGTHTWDNVQLLCSKCNSEKRDLGQMRLAI